jgi:hypothetical protein
LKSEPDRIVFTAFEAVKLGELAIDAVPIEVMERSTRWANLLSERWRRLSTYWTRSQPKPEGSRVRVPRLQVPAT